MLKKSVIMCGMFGKLLLLLFPIVDGISSNGNEDWPDVFREGENAVLRKVWILKNKLETIESKLSQLEETLENENIALTKLNKYLDEEHLPRNCEEVKKRGHNVSDIYFIQPKLAPEPVIVFCDLITDQGGWTYILNRYDGSVDFDVEWTEYKNGFGQVKREFWLGLDNIHYLTGYEMNELMVELVDWDSKKVYARYDSFIVGNEDEGYSLKLLEGYSGNAGDSLSGDSAMKFSTKTEDHDLWSGNCAEVGRAGWWFRECSDGLLTGKYLGKKEGKETGMYWNSFHGNRYSLKEARMMVRPRNKNFNFTPL